MSRPVCSVVMASFNRAPLLERSLDCYAKQEFDNTEFELVVIDDHSQDDTYDLVMDWSSSTKIKTTVLIPSPKTSGWRDCGAVLNYGIRASSGQYILLTHPEVMPGRKSVTDCVNRLKWFEVNERNVAGGLYACCKVYYLSPQDQKRIDSVDWQSDGALTVRDIEGFYTDDKNGHPDYRHEVTDKVATPGFRYPTWESWVFGGCSRETWKYLGGMLETQAWGSVDVAFMQRRRALGIPNFTCPNDNTIVIHQNHDGPGNTPTPRVEAEWRKELNSMDFMNPAVLKYPHVDYLGW